MRCALPFVAFPERLRQQAYPGSRAIDRTRSRVFALRARPGRQLREAGKICGGACGALSREGAMFHPRGGMVARYPNPCRHPGGGRDLRQASARALFAMIRGCGGFDLLPRQTACCTLSCVPAYAGMTAVGRHDAADAPVGRRLASSLLRDPTSTGGVAEPLGPASAMLGRAQAALDQPTRAALRWVLGH